MRFLVLLAASCAVALGAEGAGAEAPVPAHASAACSASQHVPRSVIRKVKRAFTRERGVPAGSTRGRWYVRCSGRRWAIVEIGIPSSRRSRCSSDPLLCLPYQDSSGYRRSSGGSWKLLGSGLECDEFPSSARASLLRRGICHSISR